MDVKKKKKLVNLLKEYSILKQDISKIPYKFRYRQVVEEMYSVSFQVQEVDTENPKDKFQYVSIKVAPSSGIDPKVVTAILRKLRAYYVARKMSVSERGNSLLVGFKKTDKVGSGDNRRSVVMDDVQRHLKSFTAQYQLIIDN